jgi:hypothetical protein
VLQDDGFGVARPDRFERQHDRPLPTPERAFGFPDDTQASIAPFRGGRSQTIPDIRRCKLGGSLGSGIQGIMASPTTRSGIAYLRSSLAQDAGRLFVVSDRRDAATGNPIVELVASRIDGDVRTISVRSELPAEPIAPASLIDPISRDVVLELHRLVGTYASESTFETYGNTGTPPKGSYVLQGWWGQEAFDLVRDTSRVWMTSPYPGDAAGPFPDNGPDYCLLTYESLKPGEVAYTDGRGSWVSPAGYRKFIESDLLRLRGQPRPEPDNPDDE